MDSRMTGQAFRVLDTWSNYDFKSTFDTVRTPVLIPLWVGDDNLRRLRAYALLESYYSNASRYWLSIENEDSKKDRREYGDPLVLVETALTSLLGESQRIIVPGAMDGTDAAAAALQEILEQWSDDEKFPLKLIESERQSVKLGDSVYVLGWDVNKQRPRLNVYDPGFYFPVFDEMENRGSEDFPNKVHIAYEFEKENSRGEEKTYVRRITWEIVQSAPYTPVYAEAATTVNCLYADKVWELSNIGKDVNTFSGPLYQEITPPTLLNLDFIPVVHIPNTVNMQNHYGRSVLSNVMHILDDIQATDTDLQKSSATTGSPPIVVTGRGRGNAETETYGPGTIFYVGDGTATLLDTSTSLDALLKLKDALLERLSVNGRVPESLLGRVKPSEVPSGIALSLSFTPHTRMINEMRLVRKEKYKILLKFVGRFFGIDGFQPEVFFGSFLPADKQETVSLVTQLLGSKAVSLETAVRMLAESGVSIDDITQEIALIQSRDTDTAMSLVGISGDPNDGMRYLGLPEIPDAPNLLEPDANTPDPKPNS